MKLAVTDANIFIDLFHIGLINELFESEIELYSTTEVIFELKEEQQEKLLTIHKLTIVSTDDLDYLADLENTLSGRLSPADLSVNFIMPGSECWNIN